MQGGRARAPWGSVAPLRSQVYCNYSAGPPCGTWGSLPRGVPRPAYAPCRGLRPLMGPRRSCALTGAARPDGRAKRVLRPRALRFASGECFSVGCRGLPSISAATVRLPLRLDIDRNSPLPPIVIFASGLRPACSGAQSAPPAVN